ncbi:glycosyltransferase [Kordiimonas sp. SCSIO 12603]|uniref:glycosyltransferase n=1 Tax=Kordiimonas sp. SCSIO 12603 TaxID=2829596 RepID=UPI002102CAF8|nr:glycosyltransferase [Kordiimonas sp. SCSIO 12603]UTW58949.1 glycosyltransferase [Kordiimonas sp. SCSIO 12603]
MKILHIAQRIQGGLASYLEELLYYQEKSDLIENIIVSIPNTEKEYLTKNQKTQYEYHNFILRNIFTMFYFFVFCRKLIKKYNPDVIHLHSAFAGAIGRIAIITLPKNQSVTIYCAHGWSFDMPVSRIKKWLYIKTERILSIYTDVIINISKHEYNRAATEGLPKSKLALIMNGTQDIQTEVQPLNFINQTEMNFVFIGRHDLQKGLDFLLNIFTNNNITANLHILGEAVLNQNNQKSLKKQNIFFHGWQSRDKVDQFITSCDAVIMPSRWEGFGLVAIEAMKLSKPVIANPVGALSEIIQNKTNGYFIPFSETNKAAKMINQMEKSDLAILGRKARKTYLKSYQADRMAAEIQSCYIEAIRNTK